MPRNDQIIRILSVARSLAASRRGILIANVPEYGTDSVAQFTFALLLELCHRVGLHADAVRAGEWSRSTDFCFWRTPLIELAGNRPCPLNRRVYEQVRRMERERIPTGVGRLDELL